MDMRKLAVFNNTTLDGYFTDQNGDISWAHTGSDDPEFQKFIADNAQGGDTLVLGRITYEQMASYWPTEDARKNMPEVAEGMNKLTKIVFSRTLDEAPWENTKLVKGDPGTEIGRLKQVPGGDMTILGSGSIVSQLAQAGLIDEYQLMVNPVVLGKGRTMFDGIWEKLNLTLTNTRAFANGKVLMSYASVV
jgi:dihydrofolate reductase